MHGGGRGREDEEGGRGQEVAPRRSGEWVWMVFNDDGEGD